MVNEFVIEGSELRRNGNPPPSYHRGGTHEDIHNLGRQGVGIHPTAPADHLKHLGGDPYALPDGPKPLDTPRTQGDRSWVETTAANAGRGSALQELKFAISLEDPSNKDSSAIIFPSSEHYGQVMQIVNKHLKELQANAENQAPALIIHLPAGEPLNVTPLDTCYGALMAIYDGMKHSATRPYADRIATTPTANGRGA